MNNIEITSKGRPEGIPTSDELLYDEIRKYVLPRFVSRKRANELRGRGVILKPWLDLEINFYVPIKRFSHENNEINASIIMTELLLEKSGLSENDLMRLAVSHLSTRTLIMPFQEMMSKLVATLQTDHCFYESTTETDLPVIFVSNEERNYGAAAILCESVRSYLASQLGSCFTILPSSVHEVLCLPERQTHYSSMVREVNECCLDPMDRLSDHIYICKNGIVSAG